MRDGVRTALVVFALLGAGCAFNVDGVEGGADAGVPLDLAAVDTAAPDLSPAADLADPPDFAGCVHLTDPLAGGTSALNWTLSGDARWDTVVGRLELTPNGLGKSGAAFYNTALTTPGLDVRFQMYIGDGDGADGMAFVLARATAADQLMATGSGNKLGYVGLDGWGVRFDTFGNSGEPSGNWVGLTRANDGSTVLSAASPPELSCNCLRKVHIRVSATQFRLDLDGQPQIVADLPTGVSLDGTWFVGFAASTGLLTDRHAVSQLELIAGPADTCF